VDERLKEARPNVGRAAQPNQRRWNALWPESNHSIRIPEMARLITNCWICSVPSKISWVLQRGLHGVVVFAVALSFQHSRPFGNDLFYPVWSVS